MHTFPNLIGQKMVKQIQNYKRTLCSADLSQSCAEDDMQNQNKLFLNGMMIQQSEWHNNTSIQVLWQD